jgi:small GTP-binding protein
MAFKIIMLGDANVGKTSFVMRYIYGYVSDTQNTTIGLVMSTKYVNTPEFRGYLNIWDTAGQERYKSLVPLYYRGTHIAIVLYDITNIRSFVNAKATVLDVKNDNIIVALIGNKTDMCIFDYTARAVEYNEGLDWAKENSVHFFETSTKSESVDHVFIHLLALLPKPPPRTISPVLKAPSKCC